jgi:hypothetical protein
VRVYACSIDIGFSILPYESWSGATHIGHGPQARGYIAAICAVAITTLNPHGPQGRGYICQRSPKGQRHE